LTWGYPSPKKRKKREAKKEEEKISKKFGLSSPSVPCLRGLGLPSLLHLKTEDQFPISA
jgi:hypothetical protein